MSRWVWLALAGGLVACTMNRRGGRGSALRPAADAASDSPNVAERLQQTHAGGAYAGIGAQLPDGGQHVGVMSAGTVGHGQSDDEVRAPGLDQMYRGA